MDEGANVGTAHEGRRAGRNEGETRKPTHRGSMCSAMATAGFAIERET